MQVARQEAERAEAEAEILSGSLYEQHGAALAAAAEDRRLTAPGETKMVSMPDGTTMLIKHGSGGAVQVCPTATCRLCRSD